MAGSPPAPRSSVTVDGTLQTLSPRMRQVIRGLLEDIPAQARRTLAAIQASTPEYGSARDPAFAREVLDMIEFNLRVSLQTLLSRKPPRDQDLGTTGALVRRRVHQGIPLSAVLQAFRIGFRAMWDVMLDVAGAESRLRDELLFKVSPFIMYQSDLLAQTLSVTYLEESRQRSHWRDRLRHELCGILYADPDDAEGFRERALALGLDPSAPHLALALRMPELKAAADEQQADLEAALGAAGKALACEPETLLRTLRPGHLLLWLPQAAGAPAAAQERGIAAKAAAIAAAGCGVDAVGMGLAEAGALGWRRSGEQALKAIEIGRHFQADDPVFLYSDVALEDTAMASPVLARLLQEQLQGMSTEPMLLETLQAWCEHGPHRKVVADVLRIHPNTLAYRLERTEALLGERLDDPRRMARWLLALRLRRLSLTAPPAAAGASRRGKRR